MTILKNSKTIIALFFCPCVLLSGCMVKKSKKSKRPNFLVILTDDQTYRAIGYNNDFVKTPNLDKLANDGVIFNRAYVSTPISAASRASLITGLYPQTNGTVALGTQAFNKNVIREKKFKPLPEFLNEAGYSTWFCGKSHLGAPRKYEFQFGTDSIDFSDKTTFYNVSEFVKEIASQEDRQPFFLWVAANQPHIPLNPDKEWIDMYADMDVSLDENFRESPLEESFFNQGLPGENLYRDSDVTNNYKNLPAGPPRSPEVMSEFIKTYYAVISHLDYQVGELVKQMKSKGLMKNTVIIFLSDNGYFLGNHGLGNKLTMHEESVRVPFFINWDKLKKNYRTDALISSIDIFPTILEMAGITIPDDNQGVSLVPFLSYMTDSTRNYVVSESVGVKGKVGEGHRMVVTDEWKYILSGTGEEALFNLKNDIYELNNLIGESQYQEKIKELRGDLREWKSLTGDKKDIPE